MSTEELLKYCLNTIGNKKNGEKSAIPTANSSILIKLLSRYQLTHFKCDRIVNFCISIFT